MSTAASSHYFRRRTIGRAASPPTWACYEQIPYDEDSESSESCSEDDDEYSRAVAELETLSDEEKGGSAVDGNAVDDDHDLNMDIDEEGMDGNLEKKAIDSQKDVKGKRRAVEPETMTRKPRRRRQHLPAYTLRPILTIQKSQGFVWNQDLFVPPYIKDRYVASTSPPNAKGFISTSVSSTNSAMTDYEVEVVEIRVNEGDLGYHMS